LSKKLLSFVIPAYCEQENLRPAYQAIKSVMEKQLSDYSWEIIFVDDGSPDNSAQLLAELSSEDPKCGVVELSRNFGKEIALSAGVNYASGDAVICLDADLQHPPDHVPDMVLKWEEGNEVVEMLRSHSKNDPWLRRLGSGVFYSILRLLSSTDILAKTTDFRLMDRKVVDALGKVEERQRMFRGIIDWLGFRKTSLSFQPGPRKYGVPVYSYAKLINLALNSFISYSSIPLKLIGVLGLLITGAGLCVLLWMIATTIIAPGLWNYTPLAFVVVINLILAGVILTALGLMSLYISKIFSEVQNRPLYAVRKTINLKK